MQGEVVVHFDGQKMRGAHGYGSRDCTLAGTDFDDCAPVQVTECGTDAINSFGIVEKVLTEFGFGRHRSFDGRPAETAIL